jgi:hypothetical protein
MTTTLRVTRRWAAFFVDRDRKWQIIVDGDVLGSVGRRQATEVAIAPGRHTLRVRQSDRFLSRERSFAARDEEVVNFGCHSQRLWPMYLASLVKPDLWIVLRRE